MIPNTAIIAGEKLYEIKTLGLDPSTLALLKERAEHHMSEEPLSVTRRSARGISKDPHDYASYGPYWWPNPDTPDGLPYIRRDGEVKPGSIEDITPRRFAAKVFELALAAYFFDSEEYGKAAEDALYIWYLNPETYMTPHAEYAQGIPGICTGRGIGIIDFLWSFKVFEAIAILESLGYIKTDTVEGVKRWHNDFADWLLTSENGLTEDTEPNNHGTAFDCLLLAIATFTGREALAKKICTTAYHRRFKLQIEPNGKMPLELARATGMHYTLATLRICTNLATLAKRWGYTEFTEEDKDAGVCLIKAAIDYIYPYVLDPEAFPYSETFNPELVPTMDEFMMLILEFAETNFKGEGYREKAEKLLTGEPHNIIRYWLSRDY